MIWSRRSRRTKQRSPASVAEDLVAVWESALSVSATYTQTRSIADNFVDMPIVSATAEDGILTVVASGETLSNSYAFGVTQANINLNISNGKSDISSEFVNMKCVWHNSTINTKEDLKLFRDCVNAGGDVAKYITVTVAKDIDLAGEEWVPTGTMGSYFSGIFDGGGHTISNLTINCKYDHQGLFGYASGIIKDLILANPQIVGGDHKYIGAICGSLKGGKIIGCGVSGGSISGSDYVGGLVGQALYSIYSYMTACYNASSVTGTSSNCNIGGVVGYNYSSVTA